MEDLGIFSCVVTNTEGVSSSYTLTEEGQSARRPGISAAETRFACFFLVGEVSAECAATL